MSGPRVTLSQPCEADKDDYIAAVRVSRSLHHPWLELDDTGEGFSSYLQRYALEDQRAYLVRDVRSNALVGFVNANNIVFGAFRSTFLGYGAFAGGEGRGLLTEAVGLAITDLFHEVGLHRVEANIQPGNKRSIRLVERLGFRKEGLSPDYLFIDGAWRDHERWALTSEMRDVPR
jgi:ribosomal-protein-alanine N-acetyltransferase